MSHSRSAGMQQPPALARIDRTNSAEKGGTLSIDNSLLSLASEYGVNKVNKRASQSFGLAIFAGSFIALAFVFYITVTTGASGTSWGLVRLMGGIAFSLGLILVVVLGGELFTSTVLSTVAWAKGRVSTKALAICWGRVYMGNFVGACLMLTLVLMAGLHQLDDGLWGLNALKLAQHKIHHSWLQALSLGVLCNLLVCLGVWMTFACKDTLTKAVILVLPVAMFVSSGFEHSIANLFMVPLGIAIHSLFSWGWLSESGALSAGVVSEFSDLTWLNFISHNLIPVTLGNIIGGGVFVGLGYLCIEPKASVSLATDSACIIYPLKAYQAVDRRAKQAMLAAEILANEEDEPTTSLQFILSNKQKVP